MLVQKRTHRALVFLAWTVHYVHGLFCPNLYMRFSTHHTFCLQPNKACQILNSSVSDADITDILRFHNSLRSKIAMGLETQGPMPTAGNMLQLVWDKELQAVAQKHANQCQFEHDCSECREIRDFSVGQNLYQFEAESLSALNKNWEAAINGWYEEVEYFDKNNIPSFVAAEPEKQYGHFTQVIWGESWKVGCGYALFKEGRMYRELYTCNYGPAGNMLDQPVYNTGEPCSLCPQNSVCSLTPSPDQGTLPQYPGLCRIYDDSYPHYGITGNYIFRCDLEARSDCPMETPPGMKKWNVFSSFSGPYISVVLNGGETTILNFTTPFKAENSKCLSFFYRKGPNVAGEVDSNTVEQHFYLTELDQEIVAPLNTNTNKYIKFSLSMNWNFETKLSFFFSVPPGKPAQYLELKDINVKEGSCAN